MTTQQDELVSTLSQRVAAADKRIAQLERAIEVTRRANALLAEDRARLAEKLDDDVDSCAARDDAADQVWREQNVQLQHQLECSRDRMRVTADRLTALNKHCDELEAKLAAYQAVVDAAMEARLVLGALLAADPYLGFLRGLLDAVDALDATPAPETVKRTPPFEWTAEDKAKLVPGSTVRRCERTDRGLSQRAYTLTFRWLDDAKLSGDNELGLCVFAPLECCDPSTIQPPAAPSEPAEPSNAPVK